MAIITPTPEQRISEENARLRHQLLAANTELAALRADTASVTDSYMQRKCRAQAVALTTLNKRVRVQRLILRELNVADSELADTLFRMVKDKYSTELDDTADIVI